jgi:hypothetical protein
MKYAIEMASGGMIHIPSILTIFFRHSRTINVITSTIIGCNVGVIDGEIYEKMLR